jgi:hypothetical protein
MAVASQAKQHLGPAMGYDQPEDSECQTTPKEFPEGANVPT